MDESAFPIQTPNRASSLRAAAFLQQLGSHERAIDCLTKFLTAEPYHVEALRAIVVSWLAVGDTEHALMALDRLHETVPDDASICVEIADIHAKSGEHEQALAALQQALAIDPNFSVAHQAMARVLQELGRPEAALRHRQQSAAMIPGSSRAALLDAFEEPLRVLVPTSGENVHPLISRALRRHDLHMQIVHIETMSANAPLPACDVVFSILGFDSRYRSVLMHMEEMIIQRKLPVVNRPAAILATDPSILAWRLAPLADLTTPPIVRLERSALQAIDCTALLHEKQLSFPLLIRPLQPRGNRQERITSLEDLSLFLASTQGGQFECMPFLDLRSADGRIRCYRVALVGDACYPLAFASAYHWYIDLNGTDASPESVQEEERQFFADHATLLGEKVVKTLHQIARCIDIDACVFDVSVNAERGLTLLGVDASCDWADPPEGEAFAIRRRASDRARQAIIELLFERAAKKNDLIS